MDILLGRDAEIEILNSYYQSKRPEFIAVYGRRRVGKTFLIKKLFSEKFRFYMTGIYNGKISEQLANFNRQINFYSKTYYPPVGNWFDAFHQLRMYLSGLSKDKRIVVFIDELPWLDTHASKFTSALEVFWNEWASEQDNLMFIVCGSATTWMTGKLLGNKGGLHNRVTHRLNLRQFTLSDTKKFFEARGFTYQPIQIIDAYMAVGGVPYYLEMFEKGLSVNQNIDKLFFSQDAPLKLEYELLFRSLFNNERQYVRIVELLAEKSKGMTREDIVNALKIQDNGNLSEMLSNLCNCDFLRRYNAIGQKLRGKMYQLTDLYLLFYLKFVKNYSGQDEAHWSNIFNSGAYRTWCGYAFEQVCLRHINQIKMALGISGVASDVGSWSKKGTADEKGCQIDLVVDRADKVINLCEIKYSQSPYEIDKQYATHLLEVAEVFRKSVKTNKAVMLTMITSGELKKGVHNYVVQNQISFVQDCL